MVKTELGRFTYTLHYLKFFALIVLSIIFLGCGIIQSSHMSRRSLQQTLQVANMVTIGQYGVAQDGTRILDVGLAVLSEHKNPQILQLLKSSVGFHSNPPAAPADYVLVFESYQDRPHSQSYDYIISTGELGHDHEWCYVPATFRAWMKTLPKPRHAKFKIIRTPYYDNVQQMK